MDGLLQISYGLLLAHANLMELLVADQRIGNLPEGSLNGLPISDQSLLVLGFGQVQIPAKSATGKNWLAHLRAVRPDAKLRTHEAGERAAPAERAATGSECSRGGD